MFSCVFVTVTDVVLGVKTKEYDTFQVVHLHFIFSTVAQIYMIISAIWENWLLYFLNEN